MVYTRPQHLLDVTLPPSGGLGGRNCVCVLGSLEAHQAGLATCRYSRARKGSPMLGEKSAGHIARLALRKLGHGTEEILGWDSGAGTITNQGKRWTGKLLLIATPLHVCLYAVHEGPMSVVDW